MKRTMKWLIMPMLVLCMLFSGISVTAASAKISKKSATLTVGERITLSVKNNKKKVVWKSDNKKVATVSGKGVVTAKKQGKATITATVGAKKYTCKVTVKAAPKVKKVRLSQGNVSLEAGQKLQLQASVLPANAGGNKKIKWSSSNTKVAAVSGKGVVTAKKPGSAIITATVADGSGKKATCKITVTKPGSTVKPGNGDDGSSKEDGASGSKDGQGSTGNQESTGSQEGTDTQGTAGSQGSTGTQDNPGTQGSTGTQGDSGSQGNTGTQDNPGTQGGSGTQGNPGTQGDPGTQGGSGSQTPPETTKTVVKIKASCNINSASSIEEVRSAKFSMSIVYSDGTEEALPACKIKDIKEDTISNEYLCTISSEDDKYSITVEIAKKSQTVKDIKASCKLKEVPFGYLFKDSDFEVYEVYSDGTEKEASFQISWGYESGFYHVTVTCGDFDEHFEEHFKVKVQDSPETGDTATITGLSCTLDPAYVYVGDKLADGQLKVTAKYSDKTSRDVTDFECDFVPRSAAGPYKFKVSYQGLDSELTIMVIEKPVEAVVTDIEAACIYDEVSYGYKFTTSDFVVNAVYSDGTTKPAREFEVGLQYAEGYCDITITACGFTKKLQVKVTDSPQEQQIPKLTGVSYELNPTWVYVGEGLKEGQLTITAQYSDGKSANVTDFNCDFEPQSVAGNYTFTVTWKDDVTLKDMSRKFTIEVRNKPSDPEEVKLTGIRAEYKNDYIFAGDTPKESDILVVGTYSDGSTKEIKDFELNFTAATEHKGKAVIAVKYNEYTFTFQITFYVKTEPKRLSIRYKIADIKVNEGISRDWIKVFATDYEGNEKEVDDFTIDFTPQSKAGTYPCTVSYRGLSQTFMVTVVE